MAIANIPSTTLDSKAIQKILHAKISKIPLADNYAWPVPVFGHTLLTPRLARHWLLFNKHNRNESAIIQRQLQESVQLRQFRPATVWFTYLEDSQQVLLLDQQNVLSSVAAMHADYAVTVIVGVCVAASLREYYEQFQTFDTIGHRRTLRDFVTLVKRQYQIPGRVFQLCLLARGLALLDESLFDKKADDAPAAEIAMLLVDDKLQPWRDLLFRHFFDCHRFLPPKLQKRLAQPGCMLAFLESLGDPHRAIDAAHFVTTYMSGHDASCRAKQGSLAQRLRNLVISRSDEKGMTQERLYQGYARAWQNFRDGKSRVDLFL